MANAVPRDAFREAAALAGARVPGEAADEDGAPEGRLRAALHGGGLPRVLARGRDAAHRIAVYRNGIVSSLADALAATHPLTRDLMGAEMFRAAAVAYARERRPATPVLHGYGEAFADLLATLPGLAPYPFVPEVARIEFARVAATHAADAAPLDPAALASAPDLESVRLRPHPATRLVATPGGGFAAWRKSLGEAPAAAAAALVTRPAMAVLVTPLDGPAARLAARLLAGATLGEAAEEVAAADLAGHLATLLTTGAFAGNTQRGAFAGNAPPGAFAGNTPPGAFAGNAPTGAFAGDAPAVSSAGTSASSPGTLKCSSASMAPPAAACPAPSASPSSAPSPGSSSPGSSSSTS